MFSITLLVFILLVQSISLCKCCFLDCHLVFLFISLCLSKVLVMFFCSLSAHYLICSIALMPKVVLISVLYLLVVRFVSFVAAKFYPSLCVSHVRRPAFIQEHEIRFW